MTLNLTRQLDRESYELGTVIYQTHRSETFNFWSVLQRPSSHSPHCAWSAYNSAPNAMHNTRTTPHGPRATLMNFYCELASCYLRIASAARDLEGPVRKDGEVMRHTV